MSSVIVAGELQYPKTLVRGADGVLYELGVSEPAHVVEEDARKIRHPLLRDIQMPHIPGSMHALPDATFARSFYSG